MPKRNRKTKRMRGGMWPFSDDGTDSSTSSGDGWFGSLKKNASSASGWLTGSNSDSSTPTSYTPPTTSTYGGRRRHRMHGGYSDNMSTTNLASQAGQFSGSTARAHSYVGGRTKRRCHKHKSSRKRHCRK